MFCETKHTQLTDMVISFLLDSRLPKIKGLSHNVHYRMRNMSYPSFQIHDSKTPAKQTDKSDSHESEMIIKKQDNFGQLGDR